MKSLLAFVLLLPGSGTPDKTARTPDEALDRVLALPEVLEFVDRVRGQGVVAYQDGEPAPGVWNFYVGENHPTHTVRWNTYRVNSVTGDILRWDVEIDGWVSCLVR